MLYMDMNYRDYFHKYLVFEVDNLTDEIKDKVNINDDDCFILCTNYINEEGQLVFPVLSVGNSENNCFKGLELDEELIIFPGIDLAYYDATLINPTFRMMVKGTSLIEKYEKSNQELEEIRNETSLDFVRNPFYPDNLLVKYNSGIIEDDFDIKITKIGDYIIEGVVEASELNELNGGIVKAISYSNMGERRLITIVANDNISDEDMKILDDFLIELSKGINKLMPNDITKS